MTMGTVNMVVVIITSVVFFIISLILVLAPLPQQQEEENTITLQLPNSDLKQLQVNNLLKNFSQENIATRIPMCQRINPVEKDTSVSNELELQKLEVEKLKLQVEMQKLELKQKELDLKLKDD